MHTDKTETRKGNGGHAAAIVALFAIAVIAVGWFWITRQPASEAGLGAPHGVIVIGAGALVTALIAHLRAMSLSDVLDMLWELIAGFFSLLGAALKAIWHGILSIFGFD